MLDSVYRMSTPNIEFCLFNVQTWEKNNSFIHNVDGISEKNNNNILIINLYSNFNSTFGDEPNNQSELALIAAAPWCIALQSASLSRYLASD